jgi:hypothetical protein
MIRIILLFKALIRIILLFNAVILIILQENDLPDGFNFYSSSLSSRVYQEEGDDEIDLWIKVIM